MIVWNRKKVHRLLSASDRERYIHAMSTNGSEKVINWISILLNIAVPVTLYFCLGFNLILFGAVFIAMDIVLNIFEQIAFITIPYWKSKTQNVDKLNRRVKKVEKEKERVKKKIVFLRDKYCEDCNRVHSWNRSDCTKCETMSRLCDRKSELEDAINRELNYIKTIDKKENKNKKSEKQSANNKITQEICETNIEKGKDFFASVAERLNKYINEYRFDFLIALRKSANSLSEILKGKPSGKDLIPLSVYNKLERIPIVLSEIIKLEKDEQRQYLDELKTISSELSDKIQLTISSINKSATTDPMSEIEKMMNELKDNKEEQ